MKLESFFSPKSKKGAGDIASNQSDNDDASVEPPNKKLKQDDSQSIDSAIPTPNKSFDNASKLENCIALTESPNSPHKHDKSSTEKETNTCNDAEKKKVICISENSTDMSNGNYETTSKTTVATDSVSEGKSVVDTTENKEESDTEKSQDESMDYSDDCESPNRNRLNVSPKGVEGKQDSVSLSADKDKVNPPKQKRRKLTKEEKEEKEKQRQAAKEAREKEKEEARLQKEKEKKEKQEEKEKKEKERLAKKEQLEKEKQAKKEQLDKEKQAKKEQQEKERLEKEKLKEEERKKKQEILQAKEEEKKKKEEERQKKEEEMRQKEEEKERKREKERLAFKSFFIKKKAPSPKSIPKAVARFEPFELKPNMTLAPTKRVEFGNAAKETVDSCLDTQDLLDYEVDSDDEWEEEEPGESLSGPENDDEEEGDEKEAEEDDDDGFFVPHGYLSDDEGIHNDSDEEGGETFNAKDRKLDKIENYPFGKEDKSKALKAFYIGCSWCYTSEQVHNVLKKYEVLPLMSLPIDIMEAECETDVTSSSQSESTSGTSQAYKGNTPMSVPEEAMPLLIKHVHGSKLGINKLVQNFLQEWDARSSPDGNNSVNDRQKISKRQVEMTIKSSAKKDGIVSSNKSRYIVHRDILERFGISLEKFEIEEKRTTDNENISSEIEKHGNISPENGLLSCTDVETMEVSVSNEHDRKCSGSISTGNGKVDCLEVAKRDNGLIESDNLHGKRILSESNSSVSCKSMECLKDLQNIEEDKEAGKCLPEFERSLVDCGNVVKSDSEYMEGIEPIATDPVTQIMAAKS